MTLEDEMVIGRKGLEKFFGVTYRTIRKWKKDPGFRKLFIAHPFNQKPCMFKQDAIMWISASRKYPEK